MSAIKMATINAANCYGLKDKGAVAVSYTHLDVYKRQGVYNVSWFPEDGASFPIRVAFMKDVATIGIDTSGVSLHKRGYRQIDVYKRQNYERPCGDFLYFTN